MADFPIPKFNLGPSYTYNPHSLKQQDISDLRKEYSRLRKIANKRLSAMERGGWTDSEAYRRNAGKFAPLKDVQEKDLPYLLTDIRGMLTSRRGSVTGLRIIRDETIATLKDQGITFVNKRNYRKFTEFMEWARSHIQSKLYDSKQALTYFGENRNRSNEWLKENFKFYEENIE